MPLTRFQKELLALLAPNRSPESYMAGGTALHFRPNSTRFSRDFDIFHDSESLVAEAFARDRETLEAAGYKVEVTISQPGFIRSSVSLEGETTQIDWAHDSAWRFMPVQKDELGGYVLHEIDLATSKVLALAGRSEPRDLIDVLYVTEHVLPLGPLVWAAVEKDPGFSPLSLLEMLKRRGHLSPDDLNRLELVRKLDPRDIKRQWLRELDDGERFILSRPPEEAGCLYWSIESSRFVVPEPDSSLEEQHIIPHHGRPGGVLPRPSDLLRGPDVP